MRPGRPVARAAASPAATTTRRAPTRLRAVTTSRRPTSPRSAIDRPRADRRRGLGVTPGAGLAAFYAAKARWRPCTASFAAVDFIDLAGYQCATVAVPLDYRHPAGKRIAIGIARLPASGAHRLGSLVINPGGPGVSGLDYLTVARTAIPASIRSRFDIVGFDPRGVGVSAGLHCLGTSAFDAMVAAPPVPSGKAQVAAAVARAARLAAGCRATAAAEAPYLGTVYSARDLDLVRSAIGDRRLTYLGKSYGTLLGAVYADEFPTRVRALVLDGALPPGLPAATASRQQADGFERDLRDFLAQCSVPSCPWPASGARAGLNRLLAGVAAKPLRSSSGRTVYVGQAISGVTAALYSTSRWPLLRAALRQATDGDGSLLLELSDALAGRHTGGYETQASAFPAISCADVPTPFTVSQVAVLAGRWTAAAPLFGPIEAWGLLTCDGWPRTATPLPAKVTAKGAPPIVVVGTTGDPATPYEWATDLSGQLASARLITYTGDGHTVYGGGRSPCVDDAVDAYLIDLTPPVRGLRCGS